MAADAFQNMGKRMDAAKEAEIAAYIMRDIELRQQNAQENGVLAYGRKPVPRGRPNERFLQNTLKSVSFANRKAREDEMWEEWNRRNPKKRSRDEDSERSEERQGNGKHRSDGKKRHKANRKHRQGREAVKPAAAASKLSSLSSSDTDARDEEADSNAEIDDFLSRQAVRGRGSVGSRADEAGPFLFPTDQQEREEYEMMRYVRKVAAGPACPDWLRAQSAVEPESSADSLRQPPRQKSDKDRKEKKKAKKLKKEKKRRRREKDSS